VVSITALPFYSVKRGWVDPTVGLDDVEKRKILHWWESNPSLLACNPSLYWLRYSKLQLKKNYMV
jgi:hypothetical protein